MSGYYLHALCQSRYIVSGILVYWFNLYPRHDSGWRCGFFLPEHANWGTPTPTTPIGVYFYLLDVYIALLCSNI